MATFDKSNSNGRFTLRLTVTETATSVANNTSTLSYSLKLIANTSYHFSGYKIGYTVRLNDKTVASLARSSSGSLSIAANGTLTLCTGTYTVTHDDDGSMEDMPIAFSIDMASADFTPGALSGSGTMDLTVIPRASTIGAAAANIGEVSTIVVTRKSSAFTHSIAYKFGSLSGYITAAGGTATAETKISETTIAFMVPTSFYAQIPNAKSGICTLTIKTYSGSAQVGDAQTCKFTVTASEAACKPSVSGTVVDTNETTIALTGDANRLVRHYSDVLCTIKATAKNSASIASKAIGGTAVSGDTLTIQDVDTEKIAFAATDSRGYTTTVTVSKILVAYIKLTAAVSCTRDDQTGDAATLYITGNYFNGSFGAVSNSLTLKYRIGSTGSWITVGSSAITYKDSTYTASIPLTGMDYQTEYQVYVSVSDALGSVTKNTILRKGIPVADWGENDWAFNVPVRLHNGANAVGSDTVGLKIWSGTVSITPSEAGVVASETVDFPEKMFSAMPYVHVTPVSTVPDKVSCSAKATAEAVTVYLCRTDGAVATGVRVLAIGS